VRRRRFRERYNEASDHLERTVIRLLAVLALLLLVSQVVLSGRGLTGLLGPLAQLDRTAQAGAAGGDTKTLPETYVVVRLLDHRSAWRAYVLVNGREVGSFRGNEVVAPVKPGDLLEVDGTAYSGAVTFRVVGASGTLSQPRIGDEITTRGSIEQYKRIH
jgi:hypothetical protein